MTGADWLSIGSYAAILAIVGSLAWALWVSAPVLLEDRTMFRIYTDEAGEFRWRLVSRNGRVIADSAEGYTRLADCRDAIQRVRTTAAKAKVKVLEA